MRVYNKKNRPAIKFPSLYRGFNIVELVIAAALLLLVISLGMPNMQTQKRDTGVKAAAMTLLEDLRAARARAISKHIPVAVVIPSGGGAGKPASGYYVIEGFCKPRITKSADWSELYPSAFLFVGTWDVSGGSFSTSTLNSDANDFPFDFSRWGNNLPSENQKDYVFMFTPCGTVMTNDLPHYNGSYYILVTRGIEFSTSSASSETVNLSINNPESDTAFENPSTFSKVSRAWKPTCSISITPLGEVDMADGITNWAGAFEIDNPPAVVTVNHVRPIPVKASSNPVTAPILPAENNAPEILEVEILPHPVTSTLPTLPYSTKADGTCHPKFHNTLVIKARDKDGDNLFTRVKCQEVTYPSGAGQSPDGWKISVSDSDDAPMDRVELKQNTGLGAYPKWNVLKPDNNEDTHALSVNWNPPAAAQGGLNSPPNIITTSGPPYPDRYQLTIEVDDKKGGKASINKTIQVLSRDVIVFLGCGVEMMNSDGTGRRRINKNFTASMQNAPIMSKDGSMILYTRRLTNNPNYYGELWVMNSDGSNDRRLCYGLTVYRGAAWSPNGSKITFIPNHDNLTTSGDQQLYLVGLDGNSPVKLTNYSNRNVYSPTWSPDGSQIAFITIKPPSSYSYEVIQTEICPFEVNIINADGTGLKTVMTGTGRFNYLWKQIQWSPKGNEFLMSERHSSNNNDVYIAPYNGSTHISTPAKVPGISGYDFCWSSDGMKILYGSYCGPNKNYILVCNKNGSSNCELTNDYDLFPDWGKY